MQYMIMIFIITGLAVVDYLTGIIKAYCRNAISSRSMRIGGLHKLAEILIMTASCGLDLGINVLGRYYDVTEFSKITGAITAFCVFAYIVIMEMISIFENYAEINPEAQWVLRIVRRFQNLIKRSSDYDKIRH
ncbi:MAG: phage holin family protein [Oscillospiraceae bacterium]|nr:phage holin family protein [Oscillospiraceae bacterium]